MVPAIAYSSNFSLYGGTAYKSGGYDDKHIKPSVKAAHEDRGAFKAVVPRGYPVWSGSELVVDGARWTLRGRRGFAGEQQIKNIFFEIGCKMENGTAPDTLKGIVLTRTKNMNCRLDMYLSTTEDALQTLSMLVQDVGVTGVNCTCFVNKEWKKDNRCLPMAEYRF